MPRGVYDRAKFGLTRPKKEYQNPALGQLAALRARMARKMEIHQKNYDAVQTAFNLMKGALIQGDLIPGEGLEAPESTNGQSATVPPFPPKDLPRALAEFDISKLNGLSQPQVLETLAVANGGRIRLLHASYLIQKAGVSYSRNLVAALNVCARRGNYRRVARGTYQLIPKK